MSKIGEAYRFVEAWIDEHIRTTDAQSNAPNGNAVAFECWADAEKAGVSASSIKSAVGDLPTYLAEAGESNQPTAE